MARGLGARMGPAALAVTAAACALCGVCAPGGEYLHRTREIPLKRAEFGLSHALNTLITIWIIF